MAVLEAAYPNLLGAAREEAVRIAREKGSVHTQDVLTALKECHGYVESEDKPPFFLGAVFRDSRFVWTGDYHHYERERDGVRNIHSRRPIKLWRLKTGEELAAEAA